MYELFKEKIIKSKRIDFDSLVESSNHNNLFKNLEKFSKDSKSEPSLPWKKVSKMEFEKIEEYKSFTEKISTHSIRNSD